MALNKESEEWKESEVCGHLASQLGQLFTHKPSPYVSQHGTEQEVPVLESGGQPETSHVSSVWTGGSVRLCHSTHSPQRAVCMIYTWLFFHCSGTQTFQ